MTEQRAPTPSDPGGDTGPVRSQPLASEAAHKLLASIEQLGVESAFIKVQSAPPLGSVEVGRVDEQTLRRPALRSAAGAVVGAAVALALGLVAMAVLGLNPAPVILVSLFIGAILGALWSLYGRLLANVDANDAETGHSVIEVDLGQLKPGTADHVRQLMERAAG